MSWQHPPTGGLQKNGLVQSRIEKISSAFGEKNEHQAKDQKASSKVQRLRDTFESPFLFRSMPNGLREWKLVVREEKSYSRPKPQRWGRGSLRKGRTRPKFGRKGRSDYIEKMITQYQNSMSSNPRYNQDEEVPSDVFGATGVAVGKDKQQKAKISTSGSNERVEEIENLASQNSLDIDDGNQNDCEDVPLNQLRDSVVEEYSECRFEDDSNIGDNVSVNSIPSENTLDNAVGETCDLQGLPASISKNDSQLSSECSWRQMSSSEDSSASVKRSSEEDALISDVPETKPLLLISADEALPQETELNKNGKETNMMNRKSTGTQKLENREYPSQDYTVSSSTGNIPVAVHRIGHTSSSQHLSHHHETFSEVQQSTITKENMDQERPFIHHEVEESTPPDQITSLGQDADMPWEALIEGPEYDDNSSEHGNGRRNSSQWESRNVERQPQTEGLELLSDSNSFEQNDDSEEETKEMSPNVLACKSKAALGREVVNKIVQSYREKVKVSEDCQFRLAVSGGPEFISLLLGRIEELAPEIDFHNWYFCLVGEKHHMEEGETGSVQRWWKLLLRKTNIPSQNVQGIYHSLPLQACAKAYEIEIQQQFGLESSTEIPVFDVVLMELQHADGRLGTLVGGEVPLVGGIPGNEEVTKTSWVLAFEKSERVPFDRISLSLAVINGAKNVIMVLNNPEANHLVEEVLVRNGSETSAIPNMVVPSVPALEVFPKRGSLVWIFHTEVARAQSESC